MTSTSFTSVGHIHHFRVELCPDGQSFVHREQTIPPTRQSFGMNEQMIAPPEQSLIYLWITWLKLVG